MAELKRVIFTGGGTGGHLFPGLALVEEIRTRFPDFTPVFVGSERGIEKRILKDAGIRHKSLPIKSSSQLKTSPLSFVWSFWRSRRIAKQILQKVEPEIVVGLGGFASAPVIQAAHKLGIPTVLLEQNAVMGRANRWLLRDANRICHSFDVTLPKGEENEKHILTGNPVRKEVQSLLATEKKHDDVQTILILGGSQGAHAINQMWLKVVETLGDELNSRQIIHQTGESDCELVREEYRERGFSSITEPFFEVLPTLYRQADLVISRAGATTLAELACAGLPAILIPYPNSVRDHQMKNAELFSNANAARIIVQTADDAHTLTGAVTEIMHRPLTEMRNAMRSLAVPNAAKNVVDVLEGILV